MHARFENFSQMLLFEPGKDNFVLNYVVYRSRVSELTINLTFEKREISVLLLECNFDRRPLIITHAQVFDSVD